MEVERKDEAARRWCENASTLAKTPWRYLKVPQRRFEELLPATLADLVALEDVRTLV
jgi:type III restriction enzyme